MIRATFKGASLASILMAAVSSQAQVLVTPPLRDPKPAAPPIGQAPAKRITIHPVEQTDPLFRYRFWPAAEKRRNENPTPLVSRALILAIQVPADTKKEFAERQRQWSEMAAADLPRGEVRELLGRYSSALSELDRIENMMRVDYDLQLEHLSISEMIQTLLPEYQEMRDLGRLLTLRARLALAEKRWDDMARDCRLGFRLSEVAGHSTDLLIARLIGFAIANSMMNVVHEAIQQPDCPSLYWALASLPGDRLFDTRESIEFESVTISRLFRSVDSLPERPIGEPAAQEKIRQIVDEARATLSASGGGDGNMESAQLAAGLYVVAFTDEARELLEKTPRWKGRTSTLSSSEAVLRASVLMHARIRDRWLAWSMLPADLWDEYASERATAFGKPNNVFESLVYQLMPAVNAARKAGLRTHQQRNLLMTIEALRIHASEKDALPDSILKLRPVPAWIDSISNSSFEYQRSPDNTAVLKRAPRYPSDPERSIHIELKGTK